MNPSVHFSSATDEWSTPKDFFQRVAAELGPFDIDVCATWENSQCAVFFDKSVDGLKQEWRGRCWMNPPYGRGIGAWMAKAEAESRARAQVVVCLVPARTDTYWWHEYATKGEVRFLRGRLKFGGCRNSAPFPSALVIFGHV